MYKKWKLGYKIKYKFLVEWVYMNDGKKGEV